MESEGKAIKFDALFSLFWPFSSALYLWKHCNYNVINCINAFWMKSTKKNVIQCSVSNDRAVGTDHFMHYEKVEIQNKITHV
jgi:hypothetical protein